MKTQFKILFNILRFNRVSILAIFISALLAHATVSASVQLNDEITRGEFIKMLAQNHADNPLLPGNHAQLSPKPLYAQVALALKARGVDVLENKSPDGSLSQQEFVRITYAFSGGKANKTLFEQKSFLKKAGIVSSTDIGITTGVDGKVYQTHKGKSEKRQIELATPIFMDDKFETDDTAKAIFTFDDESTLTMSEDTVININTHVFNPDKNLRETLIKASVGLVRFKVTKDMTNGSSFKVVTPTATAGVRGTEFAVITDLQGKTTFVVLEGKIETFSNATKGKGKTFFISAGEMQDFRPDGSQSAVKAAPREFLAKVVNKTTKPNALLVANGVGKGLAKQAAQVSSKEAKNATKEAEKLDKNAAKDAKKAAKDAKKVAKKAAKDAEKAVKKAAKKAAKDAEKAVKKAAKKAAKDAEKAVKKAAKDADKAIKNAVKASAKKAKLAAKGSAKLVAKDSAKKVAKGSAKLAAKDSAKKVAKGSAKLAAKGSAKGAAKDSAKGAAKDSAKGAAKDSAKVAAKDSAKGAAKDSAKVAAKDSAKVAAKDSAKVAAKDSAKVAAKDSAKKAAKDSAKKAAKDSAKETAKQVAKENSSNGKGNS